MYENIVIGVKNRVLQFFARYAPGSTTLRVWLHRMRGVSIGADSFIGTDVLIDTAMPHKVAIGKGVVIGIRSIIIAHLDGLIMMKDEHEMKRISVIIEDDVFIGPGVTLTNDIHPGCPDAVECMEGPRIKKGAQIGANTCILPRVVIGENAVIGAGSVVTKDIPPRVVAYGNPAQVVCDIGDIVCTTGLRDKPYCHIIGRIEDAHTIS